MLRRGSKGLGTSPLSTLVRSFHQERESAGRSPAVAPVPAAAVSSDQSREWMLRKMQQAMESGRITREAFAYFASTLDAQPEITAARNEAFKTLGSQDTTQMTRYQQQVLSDHLLKSSCSLAAKRLQKAHSEEKEHQAFIKEGKRTSEGYWFEEDALMSQGVPNYIKEEILNDMRKQRSPDSPAYLKPEDVLSTTGGDSIFEEAFANTAPVGAAATANSPDSVLGEDSQPPRALSSPPSGLSPSATGGKTGTRVRFQQSTGFFD